MLKTTIFFIGLVFANALFSAVTSQNIHISHMLANLGFEEEAKDILTRSFYLETDTAQFIANQFVKWSTKKNCEMEDAFNESAFYVVKRDKISARKAINKYFNYSDPAIDEFTNPFVDWGLDIMQIASAFEHQNSEEINPNQLQKSVFADDEPSSSSTGSAQDHFNNAKDHFIEGCIDAVAAGASVMHGPFGIAIAAYEAVEASKNFVEAAKEYNEGKRIEAESNTNCGQNDGYDRSHDHDSWDRDY